MTTESKGYNGWTNYETWLLALNIDNEEALNQEPVISDYLSTPLLMKKSR